MEQLTKMIIAGDIRSVVILRQGDKIQVAAEPSPNRWVRVTGDDMSDCLTRLGAKLSMPVATPTMPGF